MSYTVVYRTGGTENAKWHRCLPTSEQPAIRQMQQIERMGYRALVFKTDRLDAVGMPEGWDWQIAAENAWIGPNPH